jgi:protoporphyrinogen oxidase
MSVVFYLSPFDIFSAFLTYLRRQLSPLPEISFEEATINRFGEKLYKLFFKSYSEKVWGLKCKALSRELAEARLQDVSLKKVIVHALSNAHKGVQSFTDIFSYPKRGIGEIAARLSQGLDIRFNSEVTGFIYSNNRIRRVLINDLYELECSHAISTMPITYLASLLSPPEAIQMFLKEVRYRSLICVFLVLKRRRYTDSHWIYFSENQIFGRLHEPKNWSSSLAPEDKTGICLEIFCDSGSDIWKMTDAEIAHQAIRDLPLLEKFEVDEHCVERVEYAYPIYDLKYEEKLDAIKEFLSSYENLFIVGRTGAFKYISMDTCVEDGLRLGNFLKEKVTLANYPVFV